MQGGLEILIKVTVTWAKVEKLSILAAKVEEIKYPNTEDYTDDSQDILAELGIETQEDDEDVEPEQKDDPDVEPEQEDDDGVVELIEWLILNLILYFAFYIFRYLSEKMEINRE